MAIETTTLEDHPELLDPMNEIGGAAWPTFMLNDPVAIEHWMDIVDRFAAYQLILHESHDILAIVNTVPIAFTDPLDSLPSEGVDWGVRRSLEDHEQQRTPNLLLGVQVVVPTQHAGKGLSSLATQAMLTLATRHGLEGVLVPLRPSNKSAFPLIAMDAYCAWQNPDGLPFDNWLRVHVRLGGEILGICSKSMFIPGSIADWEAWTGQPFPGSGAYVVPGALNPVIVDHEQDIGTYTEPNIWVYHRAAER